VTSNERSFFWRLTGWQNMEFFARIYGLRPAEASQWIAELFDLLGLTPFAHARFDTYSTGTKQRFALVRGLLNKPRVLFMDEPTKGVDPRSASEIIRLIQERVIGLWNPTIFITSHNLREIELLCQRVAIMSRGGIIALGSIAELRRMTEPVDTYRMTVDAPAGGVASWIEPIVGVSLVRESPSGNGLRELEIKLQRSVDALPGVISAIVRSGGSIHRCSVVEPAFDEVFQSIVDRAIARPGRES
jgi:ABC-2 type transport system ATP-binding protein